MNCANHSDRERVAFCQNCGKPLCQECTRSVGSAVFCEPCLAAKLAGASAPPNSAYPYSASSADVNQTVDSFIPPPSAPGAPSPGLATLLGFIPGVGAMYNGQYAKGVVHLVVFAILVSLAHDNGIFGMFVAGWVIYQAIEANHTARARLAGTALPNPFGLNDLGERLGFGKAWPAVAPVNSAADPAAPAETYAPPTPPYAPPAAAWGAPPENYTYNYTYAPPGSTAPGSPASTASGSTVPPTPPFGSPYAWDDPHTVMPAPRNRFPAGAVWLIGLGSLFLIGNTNVFHGFPIHRLIPFLLIGVGVWLFIRKMSDSGGGFADDGTPMYRLRVFRALRGSAWVILVGILFFLDSFNILSWGRSWPLFIIVGGLMTIFERSAYNNASFTGYPYQPPVAQQAPTPAAPASTSIVPTTTHDQEGS